MPTTRTLADLYVRGTDVTIDDGGGAPVKVWLQKLTPLEQEKALRKAQALRARIHAEVRDESSELFLSIAAQVEGLNDDELLDEIANYDVQVRRSAIEAEIESTDKWSKENYLQGLFDAWNDGLKDRYAEDPDDPDAKRVFDAMSEWVDEVDTRVESEIKWKRQELGETRSRTQLVKLAVENQVNGRIDIQALMEWRRSQIWLAVRKPDSHKTYYFNGRDEVDLLAQETLATLIRAYTELEVDATEGKGSEETLASSSSSAQSPATETAASSGPAVVAA